MPFVPMSALPSPEELQQRLTELMHRARVLHGDVQSRDLRIELRTVAKQIQLAIEEVANAIDESSWRAAVGLLKVVRDRIESIETERRLART